MPDAHFNGLLAIVGADSVISCGKYESVFVLLYMKAIFENNELSLKLSPEVVTN
jgi:hypothetical protein